MIPAREEATYSISLERFCRGGELDPSLSQRDLNDAWCPDEFWDRLLAAAGNAYRLEFQAASVGPANPDTIALFKQHREARREFCKIVSEALWRLTADERIGERRRDYNWLAQAQDRTQDALLIIAAVGRLARAQRAIHDRVPTASKKKPSTADTAATLARAKPASALQEGATAPTVSLCDKLAAKMSAAKNAQAAGDPDSTTDPLLDTLPPEIKTAVLSVSAGSPAGRAVMTNFHLSPEQQDVVISLHPALPRNRGAKTQPRTRS